MSNLGTDGPRGRAGTGLITPEGVHDLVGAAVESGAIERGGIAVLGGDPRFSTPSLIHAARMAFRSMGMDVIDLGTITTPGVAWTVNQIPEASGGLVISASHNSKKDNGLKLITGEGGKFSDDQEDVIAELLGQHIRGNGNGRVYEGRKTWLERYMGNLVDTAEVSLAGLHFVLDPAHGAASDIAEHVYRWLGANVSVINGTPDGAKINENCGTEHMESLYAEMLHGGVPLGVAHDGDADRARMAAMGVGPDGQPKIGEIDGDGMLYIIGLQSELSGVVATDMTNSGLEAALAKVGTKMYRADVGDRYVAEKLVEHNLTIGAEQAGHLINRKRLPMGDGIHTFLRVMRDIRASGRSPAAWAQEIADHKWQQALINVPVKDKERAMRAIKEVVEVTNQELASQGGRVLVRRSGTEEVVRVLAEMEKGNPNALAESLAEIIRHAA